MLPPPISNEDRSLYRTRYIKRNIATSDTVRSKTIPHRKIYLSKGFHSFKENVLPDKIHQTLQLNQKIYVQDQDQPSLKNAKNFLQFCKVEDEKQRKLKRIQTGRRLSLDDMEKMNAFIEALIDSNSFFSTLERTIVQSIALLSLRTEYQPKQKCLLPINKIGFILYGKVKLFNQDYANNLVRGDTLGEPTQARNNKQFRLKFLAPTSILWLSFDSYHTLKEQSTKQGFRQEFNKLDTMLRMSTIKKKLHHQA